MRLNAIRTNFRTIFTCAKNSQLMPSPQCNIAAALLSIEASIMMYCSYVMPLFPGSRRHAGVLNKNP